MNSLSTTIDALNNDEKRRTGAGLSVSEQKLAKATGKLRAERTVQNVSETTCKHAQSRVDRFDDQPEEAEEKFLSKVFWSVPLMQKSARLYVKLRKCVFPDVKEGEQAILDPATVLSMQVANLHKMKSCTARICWKEVLALTTKLDNLQAAHHKLKETHREMQRQYLKEISDDRDAKRLRGDPEAGLNTTSTDVVMFYEPMKFCEAEWQQAIFEIVKEKLKMIFDKNPDLESTVCIGQLTAMKALVESNQLTQLKEVVKRVKNENTELKFKITCLEKDYRKIQAGVSSGDNPDGVMAMDAEMQKKCHEVLHLRKQLAEVEKGRSVAQDRLKETTGTLAESEANLHESQMKVHDLRNEIESLIADKVQMVQKLERAENHAKTTESELKQLKQSVSRQRKLDKGEKRIQEDLGDTNLNGNPESPSRDQSSSVIKKALSERTTLPTVVRDAIAAAQQSEQELCQKMEENQELRGEVEVLIDENKELQNDRLDLLQEMAAIQTDAVLAKVELVAKMAEDLEGITKGMEMEDDTRSSQEQLSVTELKDRVEDTNVEIEHIVEAIQEVLTDTSHGVPHTIAKVSEHQEQLVNLHRERTALRLRLAIAMNGPSPVQQADDTDMESNARNSLRPSTIKAKPSETESQAQLKLTAVQVKAAIENPAKQTNLEKILGDQAVAYEKLASMLAKHFGWNKASSKFDTWPPDLEQLLSKLDALAEPAPGGCPQCDIYQAEILGLRKALQQYKKMATETAETLRSSSNENKALQETIERLQQHNKTLLMTLTSIKDIQSNPEVKACITLLSETQTITVFDRLWRDAQKRGASTDQRREERRQRIMQRNEHKWRLESSAHAQICSQGSLALKSGDPHLQRENVGSQKPSQRRSEVPPEFTHQEGTAQEVSVQDLPLERIGRDSRVPSGDTDVDLPVTGRRLLPEVDSNYETQGHLSLTTTLRPQSSQGQKSSRKSSHNEASAVPTQEPAHELRCATPGGTPSLPPVQNSASPSHHSSKPTKTALSDDKGQQQCLHEKTLTLKANPQPQPKPSANLRPQKECKLKPSKAAVRLVTGSAAVEQVVGHSNLQRRTPQSIVQAISPDRTR